MSFASINLRADQTIGGTALNLLAPALVLFFIRIIANQNTLNMASGDSASWFMIKKSTLGIDRSTDLGFFGETFINKVYLATYVCILVFIILSILLYKTRFGLRLRACGENPQAADSLGINVYKMRYAGTTISGALAGMGGFVYALTTANCSSNGDVAGFGRCCSACSSASPRPTPASTSTATACICSRRSASARTSIRCCRTSSRSSCSPLRPRAPAPPRPRASPTTRAAAEPSNGSVTHLPGIRQVRSILQMER